MKKARPKVKYSIVAEYADRFRMVRKLYDTGDFVCLQFSCTTCGDEPQEDLLKAE